MYCGNCGVKNEDDSRFCIACGNPMMHTAAAEVAVTKTTYVPIVPIESEPAAQAPRANVWKNHKGKLILSGSCLIVIALVAVFFNQIMGLVYYGLSTTASSDKAIAYVQKSIQYDSRDLYKTRISSLYFDKANAAVDSDPAEAVDLFDKAGAYGVTDAISEGLSKAYLNRAKKSFDADGDIDSAIKYALLSIKNKAGDENKQFLGSAYLKKADGLAVSDPDEAILIIREAKDYASEDALKPIINKAGQQIVQNANKNAKVVKLLVQDLDGDNIDEMIAFVQRNEYDKLNMQVFRYGNDQFSAIDSKTLDMNLLVDAYAKPLIKDKQASLVVRATLQETDDINDKISVYGLSGGLQNQGTFYVSHSAELAMKDVNGDQTIDFVSTEKRNDLQKHVLEITFAWNGSGYAMLERPAIKYGEGGSFRYPGDPETVARTFMEALAIGASAEATSMTYTGDRTALTYANLDLTKSYSFKRADNINFISVSDRTDLYQGTANEKIYYIEYEADYAYESTYLLLTLVNGQWQVYAMT